MTTPQQPERPSVPAPDQEPQPHPEAPPPGGFSTGAIVSPPDPRDFPFDPAKFPGAPAPSQLPPAVDLRAGFGAVSRRRPLGAPFDQDGYGMCVGCSTALMLESLYFARMGVFIRRSAWMAWEWAKAAEGTVGQNVGVDPRDALLGAVHNGLCSDHADPIGSPDALPTPYETQLAGASRLGSFHALAGDDEVRAALASGCPVLVTLPASSDAFQNIGRDGIVPPAAFSDRDYDHEVVVCGYDSYWYYLQNHWRRSAAEWWGQLGSFYVPRTQLGSFLINPWAGAL